MRWAVLIFVFVASSARAAPIISLSITADELAAGFDSLAEHLDEPVGVIALAKTPKLGLEKGDVVRTINGIAPAGLSRSKIGAPAKVVFLDALRRGKPIVIRLQINLENVTVTIARDRFADDIDREQGRDLALAQVTKDGKPSGLWLRNDWFWMLPVKPGDVIRRIDGVAVNTIEALFGALRRAKDHPKLEIGIDRIGQAMAVTIMLEDPPKENPAIAGGIGSINQLNDTTYELPRSLVDAVLLDPLSAVRGVRIVPNMTNGIPNGFKLHAIRSGSLAAKLGLMNGDTLISIDDLDLASAQGFDVRDKLRTAMELKVVIERRGKALTFVYRLK
jgi:type II secretory pathway component PulC